MLVFFLFAALCYVSPLIPWVYKDVAYLRSEEMFVKIYFVYLGSHWDKPCCQVCYCLAFATFLKTAPEERYGGVQLGCTSAFPSGTLIILPILFLG